MKWDEAAGIKCKSRLAREVGAENLRLRGQVRADRVVKIEPALFPNSNTMAALKRIAMAFEPACGSRPLCKVH